jgi:uncharacterized protein YecT (DUF1311 family)
MCCACWGIICRQRGSRGLEMKYLLALFSFAVSACDGTNADTASKTTLSDALGETYGGVTVERSMCPDDPQIELEDCKFDAAMKPLYSNEAAVDRYEATHCGSYDQLTVNFCVGKLRASAESELEDALDQARGKSALADLVSNQSRWLKKSKKQCADKFEGTQDGTGYASFVTFCEIGLAARRIDELSGTATDTKNDVRKPS